MAKKRKGWPKQGTIKTVNGKQFKFVDGKWHQYEEPMLEAEGLALNRALKLGLLHGRGKRNGSFERRERMKEQRMLRNTLGSR